MRRPPHLSRLRAFVPAALTLMLLLGAACGGARNPNTSGGEEESLSAGEETSGVAQRIKVELKGAPGAWKCAYKVVGSSEDGFLIREGETFSVRPRDRTSVEWKLDVTVATAPNRSEPIDGDRERRDLPAGMSERFRIRSIDGENGTTRHKIDMVCRPPTGGPLVPYHDPALTNSFGIMSEDEIEPTDVPPDMTGGPVMEIDD